MTTKLSYLVLLGLAANVVQEQILGLDQTFLVMIKKGKSSGPAIGTTNFGVYIQSLVLNALELIL